MQTKAAWKPSRPKPHTSASTAAKPATSCTTCRNSITWAARIASTRQWNSWHASPPAWSCTRQSGRFWPRPAAAPASTAKPRSPAGIRSTAATSASRRSCVPCVRRWRNMAIASIGNGLYARTRDKLSLLQQYRKLQAECPHAKRDPRGYVLPLRPQGEQLMPILRFQTNISQELRLQSLEGRTVESQFGGQQHMFSSAEGPFYVSDAVGRILAEQFRKLGVRVGEPVEITKAEVANGNGRKSIQWQVARVGFAPGEQPSSDEPSELERKLAASIEQVAQRKADIVPHPSLHQSLRSLATPDTVTDHAL